MGVVSKQALVYKCPHVSSKLLPESLDVVYYSITLLG